jgi:hypothetical protein
MGFLILRIYENLIKIGYYSLIKQVMEKTMDHALVCGRGITKPEGHYLLLIQAIETSEWHFLFLSLSHKDKVEHVFEIELGEELPLC